MFVKVGIRMSILYSLNNYGLVGMCYNTRLFPFPQLPCWGFGAHWRLSYHMHALMFPPLSYDITVVLRTHSAQDLTMLIVLGIFWTKWIKAVK